MANEETTLDPKASQDPEGQPAPRRKRRKKIAYDPTSERARRINERHQLSLAGEAVRQEENARKRRLVLATLLETWLDEVDEKAARKLLLDLNEFASAAEEKLLSTHPRFPRNA